MSFLYESQLSQVLPLLILESKFCVPNNFILSHSKGKQCLCIHLTLRVCVIPARALLCGRERGKARLFFVSESGGGKWNS